MVEMSCNRDRSQDDGRGLLYASTGPVSLSCTHLEAPWESDPLPYNDTGDVWAFESVPEDVGRKINVIRTTFPCYGCQLGLFDSSYEPDLTTELAVSLDEHAVLLYNVGQQRVVTVAYSSLRSIHHLKRPDINMLVLECTVPDGRVMHHALAAQNTAEIKSAIIDMIQRHTRHTARPKDAIKGRLGQKLANFIFGT